MLISVHIPKTGGTSFGELLKQEYKARVLLDYGDWVGFNSPEAITRREQRKNELPALGLLRFFLPNLDALKEPEEPAAADMAAPPS